MKLIAQLKIFVAMLVLVALTQGCTTVSLWDCKNHHPEKIYLATTPQTNNILVFYTDHISYCVPPGDRAPYQFQPLAYWLFQSTNAPRQRLPEFVDVTNTSDLVKVPVVYLRKSSCTNAPLWLSNFSGVTVTNIPPEHGYYVLAKNQFFGAPYQLWHDGQRIGNFNLPPSYLEWGKPTFWRVTLTPLAGATDLAMMAALAYVEGGGRR